MKFKLQRSNSFTSSWVHQSPWHHYATASDFSQTRNSLCRCSATRCLPPDVDATTTLVLKEIIQLFDTLHDGHLKITLNAEYFKYYWRRVQEKTSSSISGIHFGHYKTATYSETITDFFAGKITMIARCGCPPECWGHGLQVLLEKIAGVALVTKL